MKKTALLLTLSVIALIVLPFLSLAEEAKQTYKCPLCGNQFEAPAPPKTPLEAASSESGSMDSDFCRYSDGGASLLRMVVSCPACMYSAYAKEFCLSLRDKDKEQLRSMLKENPVPTSVQQGEIPPWLSWLYAARCYGVTRRDILFVGQTFHGAAYCARIQATEQATASLSIKQPELLLPQLEGLEKKIAVETDKAKKIELMIVAAQAAQRGGFVQTRDKWVSQLRKEAAANQTLDQQMKRFADLVAAEERCLEEALASYQQAMSAEEIPLRNRTLYNYLTADIMRRLRRRRSPVVGYYARVIEDDQARPDLKKLANYFIEYLNRM